MSSPGAPANISTHPAIRKIDAKIQSLEKHQGGDARRLTEAEEKIVELEAHIKTLEAKLSTVLRSVKDLQRTAPLEATPMRFFGASPPEQPTDGAVRLTADESPVGVSATPPPAAKAANGSSPAITIPKLDALLSHLGIRLITIQADECALEPMNAFGRENLAHLHGDYSLGAVESFVLAREMLV